MWLTDEQAFLFHCKLAVAFPYLDFCDAAKGILLLGPYYFDSGRCVILCFLIRGLGVWYASSTILFVCDGMYRDSQIVEVVGRVQR